MTAGRSVSSETSPVNSRGPWTTIVFELVGRFVHDRDLARLDDVERQAALPGLEDELAVLERADRGQSGQAFDLGIAQLREREVMYVIDVRHRLGLRRLRSARPARRDAQACDRPPIRGRHVNPPRASSASTAGPSDGTSVRCDAVAD